MVTVAKIEIPEAKLADFCRRWKISEFALFGSVLRDDFRPDSYAGGGYDWCNLSHLPCSAE